MQEYPILKYKIDMKRILLVLVAMVMAQCAMAQELQFSLPIMPEKMWPSDYANYEADVLNCCNYLLSVDPAFNLPKHEECTNFLIRWLAGTPTVSVLIDARLVDAKKSELLVAFMAAWTQHALTNKEDGNLINAQVATEEMLSFYSNYKSSIGKSKLAENLLKQQAKGELATYVTKTLVK